MNVVRWVSMCVIVGGLIGLQAAEGFGQFGGGRAQEPEAAPTEAGQTEEVAIDAGEPFGRGEPAAKAKAPACQCIGESASPAIEEIKQALRNPLTSSGLDFSETPLEEVVAQLQDEYKIPFQLSRPALSDAGISPDAPVTCNLQNISLKSALRIMLRQLQLTYIIRDEVLVITTPEEAESSPVTCVYDVRDLIGVNKEARDIQELIKAIVSCVASESWATNGGGKAEIRPLRRGLLVVSQTREIHEQIAELLDAVRRVPNGSGAPTLADWPRDRDGGPQRGNALEYRGGRGFGFGGGFEGGGREAGGIGRGGGYGLGGAAEQGEELGRGFGQPGAAGVENSGEGASAGEGDTE